MLNEILKNIKDVKDSSPLIHCITNPITNYNCAQIILATGAKPIMAGHPMEVEEITSQSNALLINLGSISSEQMRAMELSIARANQLDIPVVLDAVGVGCSSLRLTFALDLLNKYDFHVIKGNRSEIEAMMKGEKTCRGVDAEGEEIFTKRDLANYSKSISSTVMVSGAIDLITDGDLFFTCSNGVEMMSSVCGTGCLLGALTTTFATTTSPIIACVSAAVLEGISGELVTATGTGTFSIELIDRVYNITEEDLITYAKINIEEIDDEKF